MSTELAKPQEPTKLVPSPADVIERALIKGDLSALSTEQRIDYLRRTCESLGLNPLTRPFDFFTDKKSGKVSLYARKDCTEQLRKIHGVTLEVTGRDVIFDDCLVITVKATVAFGKGKRHDEDVGVVSVKGLHGEDKANALMKAVTKAKRRVTLSICGLGGVPDEAELESLPHVSLEAVPQHQAPAIQAPAPPPPQAALPAPAAAQPAGITQEQLAEIVRLKDGAGLTGAPWQHLVKLWGRKPSEMDRDQAAKAIADLKAKAVMADAEQAMSPDGLAVNPAPARGPAKQAF